MRIIQVLDGVGFGDAIGNHTVLLKQRIRNAGYDTEIYAEHIDKRLPQGTAKPITKGFRPKKDDILIYHLYTGTPLNLQLKKWECCKILQYHNITPPNFFKPFDEVFTAKLQDGLNQVQQLAESVERCIAMSEFSKRDLIAMGYPKDKIWVMPSYLIPFEDYAKEPDAETLKKYSDGWVNLLFVGRLAPNKKQEDIIRAFAYYKRHINPKSRLFLVGKGGYQGYLDAIHSYVNDINLTDVIFSGHISFSQIIAIYRSADLFLCMSEHEGFCVPLVEAMYFDVPIIAYNATAVPETLGGNGVLMDSKDPVLWATWIERIMTDERLRAQLLTRQRNRLSQLQPQAVEKAFLDYLGQII